MRDKREDSSLLIAAAQVIIFRWYDKYQPRAHTRDIKYKQQAK